jgi:hypothetical protein
MNAGIGQIGDRKFEISEIQSFAGIHKPSQQNKFWCKAGDRRVAAGNRLHPRILGQPNCSIDVRLAEERHRERTIVQAELDGPVAEVLPERSGGLDTMEGVGS